MSAVSSKCCCTEIGCDDCFATNADDACCRLHPADILMFRVSRAGWSKQIRVPIGGSEDCPCVGEDGTTPADGVYPLMRATFAYEAATDILVMYRRFVPSTAESDRPGLWFYDNGSFGCKGGVGDCERWRLWPPLCPQQQNTGTTNVEPACCDNSCQCSSTAAVNGNVIRRYIGPSPDYIPPNCVAGEFVCSNVNDGLANLDNTNLTTFQKDACRGNHSDKALTPYDQCGDPAPQTNINATCDCDFDGFEWLDGIMDDYTDGEENATAQYRHWQWDPATSTVVETSSGGAYKRLAETIVSVFHREKWYRACEKYDGGTKDCNTVSNWSCQVPEYWVYACAGVPIFSWEIGLMHEQGKITSQEMTEFFKQQHLGNPIGQTAVGRSLLEKLETKHWLHADSVGIGILQLKDWAGTTLPGESSPVPDTERRLVRKDLARYTYSSGHVQSVAQNLFYNARPGGWTHVCEEPPANCGNCSGTTLSDADIASLCPQVPRGKACNPLGGNCSFTLTQGADDTTNAYDAALESLTPPIGGCLNAWPFPQCSTCTEIDTCTDGNGPCSDITSPCNAGLIAVCGGAHFPLCQQTTFRATCNAIRFDWTHYIHTQKPTPSGTTAGQENPEPCVVQNHAWLWVLNENCDSSDDTIPKACATHDCPPGPVTQTPNGPDHSVPPLITKSVLCGRHDTSTLCEGAKAYLTDSISEPTWSCRGTLQHTQVDTDDRDPGRGVKAPFTDGGCGSYLECDGEIIDLGACCVTVDGTTTCVDAVTEAQCVKCGEAANASSTYHGKNSCCGDDPCDLV